MVNRFAPLFGARPVPVSIDSMVIPHPERVWAISWMIPS